MGIGERTQTTLERDKLTELLQGYEFSERTLPVQCQTSLPQDHDDFRWSQMSKEIDFMYDIQKWPSRQPLSTATSRPPFLKRASRRPI